MRVLFWLALLVGLGLSPLAQASLVNPPVVDPTLVHQSDLATLVPAFAPVQSVNSQTGSVALPLLTAHIGVISSFVTTSGQSVGTWTFASTGDSFSSTPTCTASVISADTTHVFSTPVQIAVSPTSVSYKLTSALISLNIALGSLTLFTPVPAGTQLAVICLASQ